MTTTGAVRALWRRSAAGRLLRLCAERENRPVAAVLCVCAVFLLWKARYLHYHDLAFEYPFLEYDSFQWIREGLFYRGRAVDPTYRNPGLPLVIAALGALGIESWLPLLTVALLGMFVVYLVLFLRPRSSSVATAIAVLLSFFTFGLQRAFDEVLADQWAVTFQLAAVVHLAEAEEDPRHFIPFAVWASLSFLFQYAIGVLAPVFLLFALRELRPRANDRRRFDRALCSAGAVAALLILPPLAYKAIRFGNPLHSTVTQLPLLALHFFGLTFYAFNFFAFFGAVAAALMLYGFVRGLGRRGADLLANLCVLSYALFWIFGYVWLDTRFLLYFAPFAALFLARGLEGIEVARWLGGRGAPLPQAAVGWSALALALLIGLYERSDPYSREELPLTPQTELVLGMVPITKWPGNVTVSLAGMHLVDTTSSVPGVRFLLDHYRQHRLTVDARLEQEAQELRRLRSTLPSLREPIAVCGHLPDDHPARMRREIALEQKLEACKPSAPLKLLGTGDQPGCTKCVSFRGNIYQLVTASPAESGDGEQDRKSR